MWVMIYTFLGVFFAIFLIVSIRFKEAIKIEERVRSIKKSTNSLRFDTFHWVGKSVFQYISDRTLRFSTVHWITRTELQVRALGLRGNQAVKKLLAIKFIWAVLTVFLAIALVIMIPSSIAILLAAVVVVFSLLVFRLFLTQSTRRFQEAIRKQLPNLLDMLTVSVEAGLGFDQALERNTRGLNTELGKEVRQILAEMSLGKSRRDALYDAGQRVNVEEFQSFIQSVIQAERLGIGMAGTLRIQASETRRKLGEKIKEQAMKAPIKILFPLIFFIFPALFVIILGPAVINISRTFLK